jgi:alpha-galactosidase/6-phospho-beta-glucosidase family protein
MTTTEAAADPVDAAIDSLRQHVSEKSRRKVNPAERDFLRTTVDSDKPMMTMIRDPETGEWREEIYTPNSFREKSERVHNPMDVLKHYETREKLWNEHSERLEAKTKELERTLKRARVEAEASRRLRSRKSKGGRSMNPP